MQSSCLNHYECVNHLLHKQYHQGTVRQHVSCGLTGAGISFRRWGGTSMHVKQIHLLLQCDLLQWISKMNIAKAVFFTLKCSERRRVWMRQTQPIWSEASMKNLLLFLWLFKSCNGYPFIPLHKFSKYSELLLLCMSCIWGGKDLLSSVLDSYLLF